MKRVVHFGPESQAVTLAEIADLANGVINRRAILAGASYAALVSPLRARAQPLPVASDTVPPRKGRGGPLWSLNSGPPGVTLDLNFLSGTLDPRITFTRASTATYFDAAGVMQTVSGNTPRFDNDPATHAPRGLLIEESRVNTILQSGNLAAAPWSASSAFGPPAPVVTGNSAVAPDGTMTAAMIALPACAAGGLVQVYQNVATTNAETVSIYLRGTVGGEQTYLTVQGTSYVSLRVTLTTAWQRFAVSAPVFAGGIYVQIGTDLRDATQTATPAGTIYAWGAQVEQGAFPTSYIPTAAAAVTRAVDSCIIPPAGMTPWFVSPGGSWMAEFIGFNPAPPGSSSRVIATPVDGNIGSMFVFTSGRTLGQYDGVGLLGTVNATTVNAITKGATTWAVGNAQACLNGGAVATSAALTTGYGAYVSGGIRFMANGTPGDGLSGYLRRVRYWPRVLSNAELQQVTT